MSKARKKSMTKANATPAKAGAKRPEDLFRLEQILELMQRHEVAEIEWEKGAERLHLKKKGAMGTGAMLAGPVMTAPQMAHYAPAPHAAPEAAPAPAAAPAKPALAANMKHVNSPFVGTFYRSSKPGSDAYVREGSQVKRGDVLCIVEAMKLMNEIEADFPGKIVSILVENGQPVEFGEPLFVVEAN